MLLSSLSIDGVQGQSEVGDDRPTTPPVQPWSPPSAPPNQPKETPDIDWLQDYIPAPRNHLHENDRQADDWQFNHQENEVEANRYHRREYFHWVCSIFYLNLCRYSIYVVEKNLWGALISFYDGSVFGWNY